jgi:hypothetical protein
MGFTTIAIAVPTFNQSLLSVDNREGTKTPSKNSKAPKAKIKHTTEEIAPATNAFVALISINMLPTVQPNARSLPASVGSSSR